MASVFKRGGKSNRGGKWQIAWYDHNGKRHTKSSGTTDKATAERVAKKLEADAALRREGVVDPATDSLSREGRRPITEHLTDLERKLQGSGASDSYVRSTLSYIRKICVAENFQLPSDITADGVHRYADQLLELNRSARTIGAYLTAIKGFTKWMVAHDKLARDPLARIKKPNPKADRRRHRRVLLPGEWQWLRLATTTSPVSFGMEGPERVLLYQTAIQTGLRASELRAMTRGSLFLSADRPYIALHAHSTKNKKSARQYIHLDTALALSVHVASKAPKAPVFSLPSKYDMADMLRSDLAVARQAWLKVVKHDPQERVRRKQSDYLCDINHEGELIDFHCLRHTCGAWLARNGENPKVIQTIMRHSTITLTMDTYGHLFPGQEAGAVNGLKEMLCGPAELLTATGTGDTALREPHKAQRQAQQTRRETVRGTRETVRAAQDSAVPGNTRNPLAIAKISDKLPPSAAPCVESAPLAQLAEQLTLNQ